MTLQEAENNHWRCPDCKAALREARGAYYCPICTLVRIKEGGNHEAIHRRTSFKSNL